MKRCMGKVHASSTVRNALEYQMPAFLQRPKETLRGMLSS